MIRFLNSLFLSVLLIVVTNYQSCEDIELDYSVHPYHPFDISHADISLDIEIDQHLINGSVDYKVQSKVAQLSQLSLNAAELSINEVLVDGKGVEYYVKDEKLIISLIDTLSKGEVLSLKIQWQSTSSFGLHKTYDGSFWSSMNPLAHRHWLPGFDHPRELFTVNASFDIPNELELLFNGNLGEVSSISSTKKRIHWSSNIEIPATGLGFVVGKFKISEMMAGFTKIRLFHPPDAENLGRALVAEAARLKKNIEQALSFEYPWEAINMVILSDNLWMERTHGTGTIYLFERYGNLENQLARNMYTQWFGEYHRTEQYMNLNNLGINGLLSTALHYQLFDSVALIQNPDSLLQIDSWNAWQNAYPFESTEQTSVIDGSLSQLMKKFNGLVPFNEYAEVWYNDNGVPYFNPDPNSIKWDHVKTTTDHPTYEVDISLNEGDSELTFYFNLVGGYGEGLTTLQVIQHQFEAITTTEITCTGKTDTVTFSIPRNTEFITLKSLSTSSSNIKIKDAPLYYILNQLRSDDHLQRIQAAHLLLQHSDNADLQLALSDILSFEKNEEVKASLLQALAVIIKGAQGTEELFIEELYNSSESIQKAAIAGLQYYSDNDYVRSALQTKLLKSEGEVFDVALRIYTGVALPSELVSTLTRVQNKDTVGFKLLTFIELSDSLHTSKLTVDIVDGFSSPNYKFDLRKHALELLLKIDDDTKRWNSRLNNLYSDRDPRIRLWAVEQILKYNSNEDAIAVLRAIATNEMDPRILFFIKNLESDLNGG